MNGDALGLQVLYRDEFYVAVQKPAGMLVHRTGLATRATRFAVQELRDQLGRHVHPVHRLDRATAGVLLFALTPEAAQRLGAAFMANTVHKTYLAVVRGWVAAEGVIDHPVQDRDRGDTARDARTHFRRLGRIEFPVAVDRYPSSRYSLVEIHPQTGRRHQIRQHFKHIFHPLIGDTSYGNGRHNRYFRESFGVHRLLLEARALEFMHPYRAEPLRIESCPDAAWIRVANLFTASVANDRDAPPGPNGVTAP